MSMRTMIKVNIIIYQVTKCTFHKYGPSGTVTRHDGLCILALNIINEKVQHPHIIINAVLITSKTLC